MLSSAILCDLLFTPRATPETWMEGGGSHNL